ncbi:MAG: hypothetical protein BGP04_11965 [Rhizobiales bacterium 62-17]|nr:FAD-dependent oxidoreductase [Hyphomicrobiales bacterium]OJY01651.1 MAG: hypothetical protein BGP04_11965 [Rhizobiales bacterium 62-17]
MRSVRKTRYDVVVVGGGAAGLAAAVGAAAVGTKTLLAERYGFLGGAATNAGVLAYCGFYKQGDQPIRIVEGVGGKILSKLGEFGLDTTPIRAPSGNWIVMLEPEIVKYAFDDFIVQTNVDCKLHCRLVGVERNGANITLARFMDHLGEIEVEANSFVDASGDANLGYAANAHAAPPALNKRQTASMPVLIGGVNAATPIDRPAIAQLVRSQGPYSEHGAIRANGGSFIRLPLSGMLWWHGVDVITDGLSADELTVAEMEGRRLGWQFVELLKLSLPGFEQAYVASTGPQVGVRESRQVTPRHMLEDQAILEGRRRSDSIARGCWPAEVHHRLSGPTFHPIGGDGFFDVPLSAIRAAAVDNLWLGGRTIGCEPLAYGSIRVMGTAFATGHAAGVAAACQAGGKQPDDASAVREALKAQNAAI